ncbi:hypothetical protein [Thalassotalea sp. G2M2-11]|uniref:hypothetical protein n=1 Tax=Thalassotalea sp. G2M2-11 TaxID=2787627 RepID=UPI0019D0BEB7|nr:hypothetical protein [Thalassotalea sp. G2M2-11]
MDVLTELLPPSYKVKSENTAKDKKQRGKQQRSNAKAYRNDALPDEGLPEVAIRQAENWQQVERRSGKDRREHMESRGRWFESRDKKDRRQLSHAIEIKI